jgi:hypothetical protein
MKNSIEKFKSVSRVQWLALALVIVGLAIMIPKARGMLEFYKEVQYATVNHFQDGNPAPELLRPWMSIRYISVAFAVPQKYLFEAANIQPKKETSMIALNRLNNQLGLGKVDGQPALVKTIRAAIVAYRANPVVTGLIEQKVEGWMTVAYIANSSGIPAATIFTGIGISPEGNAYKPLDFLSDEVSYPGGPRALVAAIQAIVDAQGFKPVIP